MPVNKSKSFEDWYSKVRARKLTEDGIPYLPKNPYLDKSYDYKMFYDRMPKEAMQMLSNDPNAHFYDIGKKPSHPTFSDESAYSNSKTPGGSWKDLGNDKWVFEHSDYTVNNSDETNKYLKESGSGEVATYKGGLMLPSISVIANKKNDGGSLNNNIMNTNFAQRAKQIVAKHGNDKKSAIAELDALRREQFQYEQQYAEGGKLTMANEIKRGVQVEMEHEDSLEMIANKGKMPTARQFAKLIATDHIKDYKKDHDEGSYYKELIEEGLTDEAKKYLMGGSISPTKVSDAQLNAIRDYELGGRIDSNYPQSLYDSLSYIDSARSNHINNYASGGGIHIKPENRGKFTAYKERTGKTTEEALHSPDPHVRQMANFARNAAKWKHALGGDILFAQPDGDTRQYSVGGPIIPNTILNQGRTEYYPQSQQVIGNPYLNSFAYGGIKSNPYDPWIFGDKFDATAPIDNVEVKPFSAVPNINNNSAPIVNSPISSRPISKKVIERQYVNPDYNVPLLSKSGGNYGDRIVASSNILPQPTVRSMQPSSNVGSNRPIEDLSNISAGADWNNMARYAPIAANLISGITAKKGKPLNTNVNYPSMAPTLISPEKLSTAPVRETIASQYGSNVNALSGASGGSGAALRSGLSGLSLSGGRAAGEALNDIYSRNALMRAEAAKYNAAETSNVNKINLDQKNRALQVNRENQIANQQDIAARDMRRASALSAAATGVGEVGKENKTAEMLKNIYGYDIKGNKIQYTEDMRKKAIADKKATAEALRASWRSAVKKSKK